MVASRRSIQLLVLCALAVAGQAISDHKLFVEQAVVRGL